MLEKKLPASGAKVNFPLSLYDLHGNLITIYDEEQHKTFLKEKKTSIARYFLKSASDEIVEGFTLKYKGTKQ